MKMKSEIVGKPTLDVEINNIDMEGIWLLMNDKEFFLPFERFPSFTDATVARFTMFDRKVTANSTGQISKSVCR